MADADVLRCELVAGSLDDLRTGIEALVAEVGAIDLGCRPVARRTTDDTVTITVHLTRAQVDARAASRADDLPTVRVLDNETRLDEARRAEVGRGDRFGSGRAAPSGLGRKV